MKYINFFIIILITITSCKTTNGLYDKVLKNRTEFREMANYLMKNKLLNSNESIILKDGDSLTLKSKCIYPENQDEYVISFMKRFELSEICKYNEYSNLVYFTKDAPAYFSTSRVVYDDGKSFFREKIKNGEKTFNGRKLKIIDSKLIFIYK